MSTPEWERLLNLAIEEIDSMPDPWERVMAAEALRDSAKGAGTDLVDYETYRLRAETGIPYEGIAERLLLSHHTIRHRVARWCWQQNIPVPGIWKDREWAPPVNVMDLRHLNTHTWRRNRWSRG